MDYVDRASSQLKTLYASMTPAARLSAALLIGVVVVGLGYVGAHRKAKPDSELMRGAPIAAAQLPAMEAALAKAKLTDYEIRGTSIFVPRGQEAVYMAALANANALPPQPGEATTKAVRNSSPFIGSREREEQLKAAKQEELSLMIRSMSGIESAYVIYDEEAKPGFGKEKLITATVGVKPAGTAQLDEARVSSIRHLVAGAIANLKPENVTVCDLNGKTWHGKLEETANAERREVQSPQQNQAAGNLPGAVAATRDQRENQPEPPAADLARQTFRQFQSWGTVGLIGLGLIGLLALRSIFRGASIGGKQPTASASAEGDVASARTSNAVPSPHWKRTETADPSLREELSRLVDEDPEAAANILRNWIGQAS